MTIPCHADDSEDQALVRLVQLHDDRVAFAKLVQRHQGRVRTVLRRLTGGHQAWADELAQETFLQAYQALPGFRAEARWQTWLYRIAYNVFLQQRRRGAQQIAMRSDGLETDPVDAVDMSGDMNAGAVGDDNTASLSMERRLDLQRALAALSEDERAAIVHCYFADLSHGDAAEVLGWPLGTVKTHVLRAKAKLKVSLAAWKPNDVEEISV